MASGSALTYVVDREHVQYAGAPATRHEAARRVCGAQRRLGAERGLCDQHGRASRHARHPRSLAGACRGERRDAVARERALAPQFRRRACAPVSGGRAARRDRRRASAISVAGAFRARDQPRAESVARTSPAGSAPGTPPRSCPDSAGTAARPVEPGIEGDRDDGDVEFRVEMGRCRICSSGSAPAAGACPPG